MIELLESDGPLHRLRCTLCGLVSGWTRSTPAQFHHKCKSRKRAGPADDGIPCEHRGEALELIKCGCSGIEHTWRCNNPAVLSNDCILRRLPKMPAEALALPCCLHCAERTA